MGTARHRPWQCHRRSRRQIFHVRLFQHSGHGIGSAGKSRRHKHVDQTGVQETSRHSEVSCLMWITLTSFINGSEKIGVIIEHDFNAQKSNRKEIYLLYSHTEYRCIFFRIAKYQKGGRGYFIIVTLINLDLNYSLYISATPLQSVWTMPSMFCPGVWRKTRPVWNCGRIIWPCLPDTLTSRSWESCVRPPYSWPQATPSGGRYVHYNIHLLRN